ncbi:Cytochrome c4 precursor [Botrimarina colliarenosi]|uniref:Cytochrome c4 n=1 Tax=Botrimarina colliarenosi TaxID=2528001 RepID=A0A5C6AHI2_9BACT|nr:c-type cytochrome [Botrimarina colliarenosi]TWT99454.1 Cytochrome c4 precursor [Botrimarina colliarenosi]
MKLRLKQRATTLAIFFALMAVLGSMVVVSGVAPIRASSGHWAITKWFLAFSKNRSVATHSLGIKAPELDDLGRVRRGAGHYETACANCHGSPLRARSPVALAMTPTPPLLPPLVERRKPRELYYVVQHGILFAGMPAWPTQKRPEEVWDVVAFLVRLPQIDRDEYLRLISPETRPAPLPTADGVATAPLATCTRCHGADGGGGPGGAFPRLVGQPSEYLLDSLEAYAAGERHSGVMQTVAAVLTDEERRVLANHFGKMMAPGTDPTASPEDSEAIARGRKIAEHGLPDANVPSCIDCHGPGEQPISENYPRLAGQPTWYLERQLRLFHAGHRGGGANAHLMDTVAANLQETSYRDVAMYYSSLGNASQEDD